MFKYTSRPDDYNKGTIYSVNRDRDTFAIFIKREDKKIWLFNGDDLRGVIKSFS